MGKGLDIELYPLVINYDMLSNAPLLEQRINHSHRQGQTSDVLVINLLNKINYADTRYLVPPLMRFRKRRSGYSKMCQCLALPIYLY